MRRRANPVLRVLAENPTIVSGIVAFGCMFALIAGNALLAQPGQHPGPIMNTRDQVTTRSVDKAQEIGNSDVSSLGTIKSAGTKTRAKSNSAAKTTFAEAALQNARLDGAAPLETKSASAAERSMVAKTQERLAALGLYTGKVDGLYGPATKRAIETFQVNSGLPKDGVPSPALLFSINQTIGLINPDAAPQKSSMVDGENNGEEAVKSPRTKAPMVEASIKPAPSQETTGSISKVTFSVPEADLTQIIGENKAEAAELPAAEQAMIAPETKQAPENAEIDMEHEMVLLAQKGLTVFGVDGIEPNGRLDANTVDALKRFQERYQLKTSGRPDEATIRKMIDIGALKRG